MSRTHNLIKCLFVIFLLSFINFAPAYAQNIYCVTGLSNQPPDNFLVLRSQPSRSSKWSQTINFKNGDRLEVLGAEGDFYMVRASNGEMGYSGKAYILPCETKNTPQTVQAAPQPQAATQIAPINQAAEAEQRTKEAAIADKSKNQSNTNNEIQVSEIKKTGSELVCNGYSSSNQNLQSIKVDCSDRKSVIDALNRAWAMLRKEQISGSTEDLCYNPYKRAKELHPSISFENIAPTFFAQCNMALKYVK